jgi:hypothetical protein
MNENTLVVACGYEGDSHQIKNNLPYLMHHKCPLLVLSPDDSPIVARNPSIWTRTGGKRAYIGQDSLDRQIAHLKILLEHPFKHFLVNDSDSVCLSPRIPDYVYKKDVLWSNEVDDSFHQRPEADYKFPRLAFQPPYFMSRNVIQGLLSVADRVKANPTTPFIDWCMMAWAVEGGVPHASYPDGISCPSSDNHSLNVMWNAVARNGKIFVHSIKTLPVLASIGQARVRYKQSKGL